MKRSQLSVILSMFAVFCSGIVVGAYGYHSYTAKTVSRDGASPRKAGYARGVAPKYVTELHTRLKLDDAQLAQLNSILDETRDRFRA